MKLLFKSSLTKKCFHDRSLQVRLNWKLVSGCRATIFQLGERHAGAGTKGDSLPFRSLRIEHGRGIVVAKWRSRKSPDSSLPIACHAGGTSRGHHHSRGSPPTLVAGNHLR